MLDDNDLHKLVVSYDERWPSVYAAEAARVARALGDVVVETQHIGSTSVPGLGGKPTIDMIVGVNSTEDVTQAHIQALEELGYVYRGDAGVPGRHYFRKGERYPRDYHASIIEWRGSLWNEYLLLREYLRSHHEEHAAYVDAKVRAEREIGRPHPILYWEHKRGYVEELLDRARRWAAERATTSQQEPRRHTETARARRVAQPHSRAENSSCTD